MRVLFFKILCAILLLQPTADLYAIDRAALKELCRSSLVLLTITFQNHILTRPVFVKTTIPMGPMPIISSVYIETRYIKKLRDEKHLSPSQVDEIITKLKEKILEAVGSEDLVSHSSAGDYKSLQFNFVELSHEVLVRALAKAQVDFENYLMLRFPASHGSPSALDALKSIPGYHSPFGVGIGNSMTQAGVAARAAYVLPDQEAATSHNYMKIEQALYEHYKNTDKRRLKIIEMANETLGGKTSKKIFTKISDQEIFSVKLNSILRKAGSAETQDLARDIQRAFHLSEVPSNELVYEMRAYFNDVRVFEPPLEYLDSEISEARDAEPVRSASEVFRRTSFIVSVDIRDVGAYHATEIQSQISGASGKTIENFRSMVSSLNYGRSIIRLRDHLKSAASALGNVFNEDSIIPSKGIMAKSSGDEFVQFFEGRYEDHSLAALLKQATPDHRITIVKTEGLDRSNESALEEEVNDLRHIGETMAKALSESIALSTSAEVSDQFRFVVELSAYPGGNANDVQAFIYHQAIPESLDQPTREAIRVSMSQLLRDLEKRGIPHKTLRRLKNLSFFQLP